MDRQRQAAEVIANARRDRRPLKPLEPALQPNDLAEAYAVQDRVHALLVSGLGPVIGYKIGCTSKVMQDYLSIYEPCRGGVQERLKHETGVALAFDDYVRVGIECEIAVRIGHDICPSGSLSSRELVAEAVETVIPAIEIVDDRYAGGWRSFVAPMLIADDFFAAGVVLGAPVRASNIDLVNLQGRACINGVEIGHGTGADLLGDPLNALAWLSSSLTSRGQHLREGQVVLLGSVVQTVWLNRGDRVRIEFDSLGAVEAEFV